jgi:hypothetical protein
MDSVGDGYTDIYVLPAVLQILPLCTRLEKFVWSGSREIADPAHLHSLLHALRPNTSLRSLTIRTTGSLPDPVYATLTRFTGLTSVSLWVMEGQPRYMQSWTQPLAATLVELKLGRCSGVPATLLVGTLAPLTRLHTLHVRGIPSPAVPRILARLPSLRILDTDYVPGMMRGIDKSLRLPRLQRLSVTASSMDVEGPMHLWDWIAALLPSTNPERSDDARELGLEAFSLSAFAMQGRLTMPARFLMFLHREHRHSLRKVLLGETQLSLQSLKLLCSDITFLEEVGCALAAATAAEIAIALAAASHLREAWLHVSWLYTGAAMHSDREDHTPFLTQPASPEPICGHLQTCACQINRKFVKEQDRFDATAARQMMMKDENSGLRLIAVNDAVYTVRVFMDRRPHQLILRREGGCLTMMLPDSECARGSQSESPTSDSLWSGTGTGKMLPDDDIRFRYPGYRPPRRATYLVLDRHG